MYCTQCGTLNDDNAEKCLNCGNLLRATQQISVSISNYLVPAILVTIFCCVPLGIPAIVFAAQVKGKIAAGDMVGAKLSLKRAKIWTWVSFGVGLSVGIIYLLFLLLLGTLKTACPY